MSAPSLRTNFPHYFTWSDQPSADKFPVVGTSDDEFILRDEQRVYDFVSTSFQANFGHTNERIRAAVHEQLDRMPIASPKASFELKERCSHQLAQLIGLGGGKIFYTVSGSESVENALKMARQITGRTKIAARQRSYHGASLGALSVTGDWRNLPHFTIDEHTVRIPEPGDDPDLAKTRRVLAAADPSTVAAIIVETVSGANGVIVPDASWFAGIQALCEEFGMMLIADEVLCGFGRTGPAFAFQHYPDLRPDFVCMSKAITGGYIPFGAIWTSDKVAAYYATKTLACGLTNYGHPLGCAATLAVIDLLRDSGLKNNKASLETQFGQWIDDVADRPEVSATRCKGLLAAIEFHNLAPTWEACFEHGAHVFSRQNTLVLGPPFTSSKERLQAACESLVGVFTPC